MAMPGPTDCATLQAYFEGVDNVRAEHEQKWGTGRLELLAPDELRARFRRQQATWSMAYQAAWDAPILTRDLLDAVIQKAASMQRAWAALEAAAEEAGHRAIYPDVWEVQLADGTVAAIVQTDAEASKVIADGRHVNVYTLREIANVIDALPETLKVAKVVFQGAKFLGAGDRSWVAEGDDVPFGNAA
jgi:hypothetical protein